MSDEDTDHNYEVFMWMRRIQLILSALCLAFMIADIIKRKTYVYNSVKLFMFVCLFYLIGMVVVLPYGDYISGSPTYDENMEMNAVQKTFCGASAFINLFFYNIAYFFAVLITGHLYQVLNDNYRGYMKSTLTNKKIILGLLVIFILYLLPWIFIYDEELFYYYPTGFYYKDQLYLFLCGINPKKEEYKWQFIAVIYITSVILFVVHSILLYMVSKKKKQFEDLERLNSKQKFIISSNTLSLIVFFFQFVNLIKSIFVTVTGASEWLVIVLNYLFDLYPFLLLIFYCRDVGSRQKNMIRSSTLLSSQQLRS